MVLLLMTAALLAALPALAQPQPGDLTYLGAFAIPDVWGQRGLSYDPTGNGGAGSLWVTGHDFNSDVFEMSIPTPMLGASSVGQLPVASVLTGFRQMTSNCRLSDDAFLASVEVLDGRVYSGCSYWYNVSGSDYETMHSRLENWTGYQGPDHVGPPTGTYIPDQPEQFRFHSSKIGGYLFSLPQDWADQHTNGWRMVAGFQREAGANGGSQGPPLIAFNENNPTQAIDLMWYREILGSTWCAGPNVTNPQVCDFPNYRACDVWSGADWVRAEAGDAILVVGAKYTGNNNYSGGYYCGQGDPQILFYDPDDIVDRLAGNREPWEILPYAIKDISGELWKTSDPIYTGTWTGGMTFDEAGGRLYVTEKALPNGTATDGESIVHVWSVDTGPPPPPPTHATLSVNKTGSGTGTVTSSPAGINCGVDCQETYVVDTTVTMIASPNAGFEFTGWSGHADCSDGTVTLSANRNCTAAFDSPPPPPPPPPVGSLVAAYGFEEGAGPTVNDESGNLNHGTRSGASWTAGGYYGGALSFDGLNDRVDIPDASSLDLTNGMTLEAWVRPDNVSSWRTVLMKQLPSDLAYGLWAHDSNFGASAVWVNTTGPGSNSPGTQLPTGAWNHLAATYDGSTLRLYINGVQVGSSSVSGNLVQSSEPLTIGGNMVWGEYFDGLIDEVRVYDRPLSAAEIQADMAAPVSCFGQANATVSGVDISGVEVHQACDVLTVGPSVTISGQATFRAGQEVRFIEPITIEDSAIVEVSVGPPVP